MSAHIPMTCCLYLPMILDDYYDVNQYWNTHTPNYFFPKNERYPDLKTAAVVFLASAMSLVMLILLLIIILYRMNHHVREQRELQSQLRTISELLGTIWHFVVVKHSVIS